MKKERSCGAVIMKMEEGKTLTLLVKHMQGHWGFPKGHAEGKETETETAIREVKEETGLNVVLDNGFRDTSTYYPNPDVFKKVIYFIGKPESGEAKPDMVEIEAVDWFTLSEAVAALSYPSDVSVLENAEQYMRHVMPEE